MKIPVFVLFAIFIALTAYVGCCDSVAGRGIPSSGARERWKSSGACVSRDDCDTEVDVGGHHNVYTESYGHTDRVVDKTHGQDFRFDQRTDPKEMILNAADGILGRTDVLLSKMDRLRQELNQMPTANRKLNLNKKAIDGSLLDLQDQLEEVFQVLGRIQKEHSKSAQLSEKSVQKMERAGDVLEDVTNIFSHLEGVVKAKMKKFRDDAMESKENARKIWVMIPTVEGDMSSLSVKIHKLFKQGLLTKQEANHYVEYLRNQEVVLQNTVVNGLKRFQPFNKLTANYAGDDDTVAECQKVFVNMMQQLKKVDNKLNNGWIAQDKGKGQAEHGPTGIANAAGQIPSKAKHVLESDKVSKRSVQNGGRKYIARRPSYFLSAVLFAVLAVCSSIVVFLRRRIKRNQDTLPFTVYRK